jgi:hypothetical protein
MVNPRIQVRTGLAQDRYRIGSKCFNYGIEDHGDGIPKNEWFPVVCAGLISDYTADFKVLKRAAKGVQRNVGVGRNRRRCTTYVLLDKDKRHEITEAHPAHHTLELMWEWNEYSRITLAPVLVTNGTDTAVIRYNGGMNVSEPVTYRGGWSGTSDSAFGMLVREAEQTVMRLHQARHASRR